MASSWTSPKSISQSAELETHIPWNSNFSSIQYDDGTRLSTTTPLSHIANSYAGDRVMKTYYLYATGFNFGRWDYNKNTIAGIQLKLKSERTGRIVDDTIQLVLNGAVIGKNNASIEIDQNKYYGISTPWEITLNTTATNSIVQDPTFGVCIRFQSHPNWPHRESPSIEHVALRLLTSDDLANGEPLDSSSPNVGSSRNSILYPGNVRLKKRDGLDLPGDDFGQGGGGGNGYQGSGGFYMGSGGYTSSGGGYIGSWGYVGSFITSYLGSFVTHNYYTGSISNRTSFLPNKSGIPQIIEQWSGDLVGTFDDYQLYVWTGTDWILF